MATAPKAIRRMQIARESEMPKDACQTPGKQILKSFFLKNTAYIIGLWTSIFWENVAQTTECTKIFIENFRNFYREINFERQIQYSWCQVQETPVQGTFGLNHRKIFFDHFWNIV